jgi:tetratricopeptide (TPR) repeat protein
MIYPLLLALQAACLYPQDPTRETPVTRRALGAACRKRITASPRDVEAYRVLGHALLNEPAEALVAYQAGLRVAPNDYELQLNAGLALRQVGRFEESLSALKRAATLDATQATPCTEAGLVAQKLNRHAEALALFRLAIKRAPNNGSAWGYMARSLHTLGRHAEAVHAWERAEHLEPHGFIDEAGDRGLYDSSRALASAHPR